MTFYLRFGEQTESAAEVAPVVISGAWQTTAAFALLKSIISKQTSAKPTHYAEPPQIKNLKVKDVVKITVKLQLFVQD